MLVTPTLLTIYMLSSAVSALIAWYCWRRQEVLGARAYAGVALSQSLWTAGYILEILSPDMQGKIFWDNAQFVMSAAWVAAFLAFTLRYTEWRLPRPRLCIPLLTLPLIALIALVYTDPLHGLVRANPRLVAAEPYGALLYDFTGPVWAVAIYSYGAYLGCVLMLLLNPRRTNPLYRSQMGLVVAGSLMPIGGSILSISFLAELPARDISPFTFVISSGFVAWALFRFRLFDLVPIARDMVVESITDVVFVLDPQGRLIDLNPAGQALADRLGLDLARLRAEGLPDPWPRCAGGATAAELTLAQELTLAAPGGPLQIELRRQPVFNRRGAHRGCVVVARDITERKAVEAELQRHREHLEALVAERTADLRAANGRLEAEIGRRQQLEAQIVQGQKMEALGRMASGIAHDFNNVLTVVSAAAELIIAEGPEDSPHLPDLEAIVQATSQGAKLTNQLLAFSRGQPLQLVALDLSQVVEDFGTILRRLAGPRVELVVDLRPGVTTILADVGQLQQVLANLVANARDAMPDGGQLAIRVDRACLPATALGGERPVARLVVADSGTGMDGQTCQRLFEPFFTTKAPGRGTGLGLSVVYGIVTQLGGTIQVESTLGGGTTFMIDLPLIECAPRWAAGEYVAGVAHRG